MKIYQYKDYNEYVTAQTEANLTKTNFPSEVFQLGKKI